MQRRKTVPGTIPSDSGLRKPTCHVLEELLHNVRAGPPHLSWVPFDSTGMPGMVSLLDDC